MKESITKFNLEAAFKALDDIEIPAPSGGVKPNKPALTEIFSRKSKFDSLFEEYYDINNTEELTDAKKAREAEVAKAKLARIEKIVDLDAESPDELLTSYVGKYIIQCPQCMTLFYKNPEDVEESEDDPTTVNVNEICQHCGNDSGYTLIGKVGEATEDDLDLSNSNQNDENSENELGAAETSEGEVADSEEDADDFDLNELDLEDEPSENKEDNLDELDLEIEEDDDTDESDEADKDKKEESLWQQDNDLASLLNEQLTEDADIDVSEDEFEKLINSSEFKKPISTSEVGRMLKAFDESKDLNNIDDSKLLTFFTKCECGVMDAYRTANDEIYVVIDHESSDINKTAKCLLSCLKSNGINNIKAWKTENNKVFIFKLDFNNSTLTEGASDLKDKLTDIIDKTTAALTSREAKANWILENAIDDYDRAKIDVNKGVIFNKGNKKFNSFLVLGFKEKDKNNQIITSAPEAAMLKNLVLGTNGIQIKKNYKDADNIAKGWSIQQGNGPAFIYLAKNEKDNNAAFLCEYFNGKLVYDQVNNYFNMIKKNLKACKLMAKGDMSREIPKPKIQVVKSKPGAQAESIACLIDNFESLQESSLEEHISKALSKQCGNINKFKMTGCYYLNEQLIVDGEISYKSGRSEPITYTFTEAYKTNNKIVLQGTNKLSNNESIANLKTRVSGYIDKAKKTFITESFK